MHEMLLVKLGYRIVLTRRLPKFSSGKESRTSKAICNDTPNIDITIVAGVPELDQDVSARSRWIKLNADHALCSLYGEASMWL